MFPTAPTSAIVAGTIAASITFTTMSYASDATVGITNMSTNAVGFLAGRGINLVCGPLSGYIAEQATREFGQQLVTPVVRTSSRQAAYLTSAVVGASVIAVSSILIHASNWIYKKGHTAVFQYLKQTPIEVVSSICDVGNDIVLLYVDGVPLTQNTVDPPDHH